MAAIPAPHVRTPHPAIVLAATLAAACLVSPSARAVDRRVETAAKATLKRAAQDYLATDYAAGAARLRRAIRGCGTTNCTTATRAVLLRDLGTMQFRLGQMDAAKRAWADALTIDPTLSLNPDYETPDLRSVWDDVRASTGGMVDTGDAAQPTGDFTHTPAAAQKVNTPLPVYVEYPGTSAVARVVVKYQGAGGAGWSRLDLKRLGSGWGGLIPCGDVKRGILLYWIQGFDDGGDPIASSGDPKHLYAIPIHDDLTGEPPHLPGMSAPGACGAGTGCPRGPGCVEEPAAGEREGARSKPASERPAFARVWVGVSGVIPELAQMPGGQNLCALNASALPANSIGATCTNPNGTDFPSRATAAQNNQLNEAGQAGQYGGGIRVGDVRVMGAFDYALSPSWLVGARLGYVLNAYPGQAAVHDGHALGSKILAEVRGTYLFGDAPLTHIGFLPMTFVGTGVSEFDTHVTRVVTLADVAGQEPVNIWVTDAPFFVALGGGVRYQFSLRAAFTAAARVNVVVGGNGLLLTYGPEVGVLYGF